PQPASPTPAATTAAAMALRLVCHMSWIPPSTQGVRRRLLVADAPRVPPGKVIGQEGELVGPKAGNVHAILPAWGGPAIRPRKEREYAACRRRRGEETG